MRSPLRFRVWEGDFGNLKTAAYDTTGANLRSPLHRCRTYPAEGTE
jgi:hypothetical protein